jgi:hypothetical protein
MANQSIVKEFWGFIRLRKRYWLLPIVMILGLLSLLIVFTESSAIAPFIYALFWKRFQLSDELSGWQETDTL